jgi:hypothetical protein
VSAHCSVGFCLGILPLCFTCNQRNPQQLLPTLPPPCVFSSFQHALLCPVPTQMWCISLLLILFSPPPRASSNSPTFGNVFCICSPHHEFEDFFFLVVLCLNSGPHTW